MHSRTLSAVTLVLVLAAHAAIAQGVLDDNPGLTFSPTTYSAGDAVAAALNWETDAGLVTQAPCGSAACGGLDADCGNPRWIVSAGAVFLQRENSAGVFLESPGTTFLAPDLGFQGGGRVSVIKQPTSGFDYEFAYLGFGSSTGFDFMSGNLHRASVVPSGSSLAYQTPLGFTATGTLVSGLRSDFNSLEFNFRQNPTPNLALLAGFRWISLSEQFGYSFSIPPLVTVVGSTQTDNHLLGFQLGVDGVLFDWGRFRCDSLVKAGIYDNLVQHRLGIVGAPLPGSMRFTHDSTNAAFEADARLGGTFTFTDRFAVRGGYQVLWLQGVALATQQIAVTDLANRCGLSTQGSPYWHGAYVEAMLSW